jgi:hypothetical protein
MEMLCTPPKRIGALFLVLAACLSAPAAASAKLAHWSPLTKLNQVVDLSPQRPGGAITVAETTGLDTLHPGRLPVPFAPAYVSPGGDEPYMVMSPARRRGRCSYGADTLYVLRLVDPIGVTAIDRHGHVRSFATLPGPGVPSGIAFDQVGQFRHRLLVTVTQGIESALYAISCHGRVTALARHMPKVEGGMAVAPRSFGRFGGRLIAADEVSGHVYAIPPNGGGEVVLPLGLPVGSDVGVESVAFVPSGFGPRWRALVADRVTPDNPHPGDGAILGIRGARLMAAGVRPGDLLAVTEASAQTDLIRCHKRRCRARHVADGPAAAHVEGHVVFVR